MPRASVIYVFVNSLALAFERTQPATLLLGLGQHFYLLKPEQASAEICHVFGTVLFSYFHMVRYKIGTRLRADFNQFGLLTFPVNNNRDRWALFLVLGRAGAAVQLQVDAPEVQFALNVMPKHARTEGRFSEECLALANDARIARRVQ